MTFQEVVEEAEAQGWTVVEEGGRWVFTKGADVVRVFKPVGPRDLRNFIDKLTSYGFQEP